LSKAGYTIIEAAAEAGVERHHIEAAINAHQLVARKVGQAAVIVSSDLAGWLESLPAWKG